jgi:hypothetical protein
MSTDKLKQWRDLVEAYEGSKPIDLRLTIDYPKYEQEASQFKMSDDYPSLKQIADLLQSLDRHVEAAKDRIDNPLAQSIISRLRNTHPARTAMDLDRVAKLATPAKKD